MRIDLLLCRLRFAKSRSKGQKWVDAGHIRCNGVRVEDHDHPVAPGDVLTLPIGNSVRVLRVDTLPDRRGPASEAQGHYVDLAPTSGPDGRPDA
ncbi:MAG: S4 domain-containing protein [Alteraurantiacibacter sp.]